MGVKACCSILLFFCFVGCIPQSEGIKCYNCLAVPPLPNASNDFDFLVNDGPFVISQDLCKTYEGNVLLDCGDWVTVCHSIIVDMDEDGLDSKQSLVYKSCGTIATSQLRDELDAGSGDVQETCYRCYTDGCNSASLTALNIFIVLGAGAIYKLFH